MTATTIAILFESWEGQTEKIAERLAARMRDRGAAVDVFDGTEAPASLDGFAAMIVGTPAHAGRQPRALVKYVRNHLAPLEAMPNAYFSVSLSAVNHDAKHDADVAKIVEAFKSATGWEPKLIVSFAGALQYSKYNWFIRRVMKRISAKEGGDTDTSHDYEYTDWAAVDRFADEFVAGLREASETRVSPE